MFALRHPVYSLLLLAGFASAGCGDKPAGSLDSGGAVDDGGEGSSRVDADADGYPAEFDCDDDDPEVHPAAPELCNGSDDNCDGRADEGLPDADADGTPDCTDTELCDGLDNDGDGLVDEEQADTDLDGLPDCVDTEDCDGIDNNGDGQVDEGFDGDGDGYTTCVEAIGAWDCDDTDPDRSPDAREIPGDDVDNDCDAIIDPERWDGRLLVITEVLNNPGYVRDSLGEWIELYNPSDEPLYINGVLIDTGVASFLVEDEAPVVVPPRGYFVIGASTDLRENGGADVDLAWSGLLLENEGGSVGLWLDGTPIDELSWDPAMGWMLTDGASLSVDPLLLSALSVDATVNDAANAWCLGSATQGRSLDLASPGQVNPACPAVDRDGDGALNTVDCDDSDAGVYPGAAEVPYDGIDNDCAAGTPDDDLDADGAPRATDCDDADPARSPAASEVCDTIDNDCDGLIDADDPSLSAPC